MMSSRRHETHLGQILSPLPFKAKIVLAFLFSVFCFLVQLNSNFQVPPFELDSYFDTERAVLNGNSAVVDEAPWDWEYMKKVREVSPQVFLVLLIFKGHGSMFFSTY